MNVQIQTTSACNGACIICPYPDSWHRKNPGVMSAAVFQRILEQLQSIYLEKICLYLENEPLLDPYIFMRLGDLKKSLSFTSLEFSTNAMVLDREKAERLGKLLADVKHEIWVSFHGIDRRTHEGIMGLNYDRCLTNIVYLLKLADELPLRIIIRGAGMAQNSSLNHQYVFTEDEYIRFWERQLDIHGVNRRPGINFFYYHDRAGTIRRNHIRLAQPVRPDLTGFTCPRLDEWLHFLYNGELIICCMDYHREVILGDITTQELSDILRSPRYALLQDQAQGRSPTTPNFICKRCISPGG